METKFKKHVNLYMLTVRLHYSMYIISIFEIFKGHTYPGCAASQCVAGPLLEPLVSFRTSLQ